MNNAHKFRSTDDPSPSTYTKKLNLNSQHTNIVYIPDLPANMVDNLELEQLIRRRVEDIFDIQLTNVKCYSKLGVGVIHVTDNQVRNRLLKMGKLLLNPKDDKFSITFTDTIELVSYVVLDIQKEVKDNDLPITKEITRRWIDLHNGDEPQSCDILHTQFPNIYRIVVTSLDNLVNVSDNNTIKVKNLFAHIYYCADCSFFENLSNSITENQLEKEITNAIEQTNISPSSLYIQLNKQAAMACVLAANQARLWSTKNDIFIDGKRLSKKTKLSYQLVIYPVPPAVSIQSIINHSVFNGTITNHKQIGDHLIVDVSDEDIFKVCSDRGALRIGQAHVVNVDIYEPSKNLEKNEVTNDTIHVDIHKSTKNFKKDEFNNDTWYEREMMKYEPDIMQFITNPQHFVFQYKWNPKIWFEQFKLIGVETSASYLEKSYEPSSPVSDKKRHRLRVTVMLNTLGVIRKKRYMIDDREIKLNAKNELRTIVYNHDSKVERSGKIPFTKPPYSQTTVTVVEEDCLVAYEDLVKKGKRPLLLNMANATTPGGGYRKGDGAQEENLFRRSDYCRSLDIDLDDFFQQQLKAKRYLCSSDYRLEPMHSQKKMYPMDKFGGIYTSGITVFRESEDTGYAFMEKPLEDVCAIAMAAFRNPELEGNKLTSEYVVGTRKKIENIFSIAYHHKHDSLVLSAFGCGAFKNPPDHIVQIFHSVIQQYAGFFESIVFAILNDHNTGSHLNPQGNFQPFSKLHGLIVQASTVMGKAHTIIGPYRFLNDDLIVSDVVIRDLYPCKYGAKCIQIYDSKHINQYSHPPRCIQAFVNGKCNLSNNSVHMLSFIHQNLCRNGGICPQIDDKQHSQECEHPEYCSDKSKCQNETEDHLKQYRHLPLCPKAHICSDYKKEIQQHCNNYRHWVPRCPDGNSCAMFYDKTHSEALQHPFLTPCQRTPFDCSYYNECITSTDNQSVSKTAQQHCDEFAHVCAYGRNCSDQTSSHQSRSIHIARQICSDDKQCNKLNDEEHLNSYTHSNILDIRPLCPHASQCPDRRKLKHPIHVRHPMFDAYSVVRYYGSNENTDFVQNQNDNVKLIKEYIHEQKWNISLSGPIPREIINWLRTVQPIYQCNLMVFESILLYEHVMSREYMKHLKYPKFVANSILKHSQIQRLERLKMKSSQDDAREYILALISLVFLENRLIPTTSTASSSMEGDTSYLSTQHCKNTIKKKDEKLQDILQSEGLLALYRKTMEFADTSIKFHSNSTDLSDESDKALGIDKFVSSILGPHLDPQCGDIIIVFKREILHHPDANFSMQSATSFITGNVYQSRPWLGKSPRSTDERIKNYHETKLHAAVSGYDYAAAIDLIATTNLHSGTKTMNIDLEQILDQWNNDDLQYNIEAHLPQLIPLDYIDHIYIPKNIYDKLSDSARKEADAVFSDGRMTIVPQSGEGNSQRRGGSSRTNMTLESEYQNVVIKELRERYKQEMTRSTSTNIEGFIITIPPLNFEDHYVLPLTISQAYAQYRFEHSHVSKDEITYIYWKAKNGDMMLTLSNKQIDPEKDQSNIRCLICYLAPKPTLNDNDDDDDEHISYVSIGNPIQHETILNKKTYRAKSNSFYSGCNTGDYMTYCLEIQQLIGKVTLSHAGSNGIYNHEEISCTFSRSEIDLRNLEFIHISAGNHSVSIRNLIICFEIQSELHPTFDKNFKKDDFSTSNSQSTINDSDHEYGAHHSPSPKSNNESTSNFTSIVTTGWKAIAGDNSSSPKPCPADVNCLIQYSDNKEEHNKKFSHPCRFSEVCRNKEKEPYLTHEPHSVPQCNLDKQCDKLHDPVHRASYRHTGLPDFLVPCRNQSKCQDRSRDHQKKYSHGEQVFKKAAPSTGM